MLNVGLLLTWILVGALAALAFADRGESRWGDVPMATILGPLWLFVAMDRREPG